MQTTTPYQNVGASHAPSDLSTTTETWQAASVHLPPINHQTQPYKSNNSYSHTSNTNQAGNYQPPFRPPPPLYQAQATISSYADGGSESTSNHTHSTMGAAAGHFQGLPIIPWAPSWHGEAYCPYLKAFWGCEKGSACLYALQRTDRACVSAFGAGQRLGEEAAVTAGLVAPPPTGPSGDASVVPLSSSTVLRERLSARTRNRTRPARRGRTGGDGLQLPLSSSSLSNVGARGAE